MALSSVVVGIPVVEGVAGERSRSASEFPGGFP